VRNAIRDRRRGITDRKKEGRRTPREWTRLVSPPKEQKRRIEARYRTENERAVKARVAQQFLVQALERIELGRVRTKPYMLMFCETY